MRARGAIPLMLPKPAAAPVIGTPSLPPAVLAVCDRGRHNHVAN